MCDTAQGDVTDGTVHMNECLNSVNDQKPNNTNEQTNKPSFLSISQWATGQIAKFCDSLCANAIQMQSWEYYGFYALCVAHFTVCIFHHHQRENISMTCIQNRVNHTPRISNSSLLEH